MLKRRNSYLFVFKVCDCAIREAEEGKPPVFTSFNGSYYIGPGALETAVGKYWQNVEGEALYCEGYGKKTGAKPNSFIDYRVFGPAISLDQNMIPYICDLELYSSRDNPSSASFTTGVSVNGGSLSMSDGFSDYFIFNGRVCLKNDDDFGMTEKDLAKLDKAIWFGISEIKEILGKSVTPQLLMRTEYSDPLYSPEIFDKSLFSDPEKENKKSGERPFLLKRLSSLLESKKERFARLYLKQSKDLVTDIDFPFVLGKVGIQTESFGFDT